MNPVDPLAALHDIHAPPPPEWWPPAPGWWIVCAVSLLLLGWGAWRLWRFYRRTAYKRAALRELRRLRQAAHRGESPHTVVRDLAVLLRRVALAVYPREQVAGLHGRAWLEFLDATGGDGAFSGGVGKYLAHAPYMREMPAHLGDDQELLLQLARRWIRRAHSTINFQKKIWKFIY